MPQRKEVARWSDYFAFVPVVLCVAVVLYLPTPADREDVEKVRATISQAIEVISGLWSDDSPSFEVADFRASTTEQTTSLGSYNPPDGNGVRTRQLWENMPVRQDYSNGPSTRISFGDAKGARNGR